MRVKVKTTDIFVLFRVNTLLSFCKNVDITYNVSSNPPTPQKNNSCMHSTPMFLFFVTGQTHLVSRILIGDQTFSHRL